MSQRSETASTRTIFDAHANPDLLAALVLANVQSDRLWAIAARVEPDAPLGQRLFEYQRVLDKYFVHATPLQLAERDGLLDIDEITARLGPVCVDEVFDNLIATLQLRERIGTLSNAADTIGMFERREMPAFSYAAIDELHARRVRSGKPANRPIGVTSCVDEAALFAALVMTGPVDEIDGIVLLASPSHSTVLVWGDGDAWWFYGKNQLWSRDEYRLRAPDARLGLEQHLGGLDTIVARDGFIQLRSQRSTLSPTRVRDIAEGCRAFFGCEMFEATTLVQLPAQPNEAVFVRCLDQSDAAGVRSVIAADPVAEALVAQALIPAAEGCELAQE